MNIHLCVLGAMLALNGAAGEQPGSATPPDNATNRLPFVVEGRVTDEQGGGIQGVTITAHCGMGTLLPTGTTSTTADGQYVLRFAGGIMIKKKAGWGVGVQAATISPRKPGYTEANLHRQGNLLMADELPKPGEQIGFKADPSRTVLPNKPFHLDFVLVRAASIKGQLFDAEKHPMANEKITLTGPELPPSSSVLAETRTDRNGRFEFADVPGARTWWFSLTTKPQTKTAPQIFSAGAEYRISLQVIDQQPMPALELTILQKSP